ncbi:plastidial pyruvate kinase 4, chloroplastic [Nicotiana tomentosiformis]|uniref:Plastidial pyruvate kinase 4, chloroplastic-like n=1 Tax=Nicotiana tabacum TaxID=4097 RepID=A0A1S4B051_TOBAC|nr:plastidial pyruvate kinase 4, chloroplastic [Nicotiana tomentosiformis]XP_009599140.1 plastidial pyruvate kinase 4, chloroplastic [Nicotiana tomentosiformis]XP_016482162.1 PREDICTED: plastidial pyruvate kinase 4, chloroplastic-like [Nicotiana tabacum]XP_016482163.1 PREDICTED: plastidial pyruvate kinase 4, chloroplastic-like [Nicotiana tabacum]XP_016482164.1 PREDICTED: plastidial pyruvate kinase 4, chloroplastic-like [Nicotiana tabacum]XP_018625826.1 plastidial pyruvate kinase 4, chloroplast
MLGGVTSVSMFTNQTANGFQIASFLFVRSSNLSKKYSIPQPFFKIPGIREHIFQFVASNNGSLARKNIVFAIPNGKDDAEKEGSDYYIDYPVAVDRKQDKNSCAPEMETTFSLLPCGEGTPKSNEINGKEDGLLAKLIAVHLHVLAMEQWNASKLKMSHKNYLVSATNLIHYLALKSLDVEQLEEELSSIGLLNLDTINQHVLASLSAGIRLLDNLKYDSSSRTVSYSEGISSTKSLDKQINGEFSISTLRRRASHTGDLLLGRLPEKRKTHIMVTVGQEAIESETLVKDLLNAGTTIVRINCAHGSPEIWSEIIRRVKRSSQILEKPCLVLMDLAGPKLRTGTLQPGPCVLKISPKKNAYGQVICPALVWLSSPGAGSPPAHVSPDAVLHVDGEELLSKLEPNDVVTLSDARGKQRTLKILSKYPVFSGIGFMAECSKTAYVKSGAKLFIKDKRKKFSAGHVVNIPPLKQFIRLRVGDLLSISRDSQNEENKLKYSSTGAHRITCSSGYVFDSVKPGEPISFDDGKIWGIIKATSTSEIVVSITHASPTGSKLGSEKSINIPRSNIRYEGLTLKDLIDLDFVADHANMVGVSFVRDVSDILLLCQELEKRKRGDLGVVLKIETKGGFERLPLLLLEAMKMPNPLGIMIARGDLAVECGWENMAYIQEEIISVCKAAHVPVIWATQVLESLVKYGVPTRAELTDVADGMRTSCIMLNKGKCIVEAVAFLHRILSDHSMKPNAEFKPLALSSHDS